MTRAPMEKSGLTVRVYYEDTDASGIVYHARYLHFMERARTEWVRSHWGDHQQIKAEYGLVFAVSNMDIGYRQPARLDDLLEVTVKIERIAGASIQFEQQVLSADGSVLYCQASVRVACIDALTLKPKRLPKAVYR